METQPEKTRLPPAARSHDYRILESADVAPDPIEEFGAVVLQGLSEKPKHLPSRYIYDDAGSEYFRQILALPEYYPTRCEAEILETHKAAILRRLVGAPFNLVDLGAGDGAKTLILLRHLAQVGSRVAYVPVDISTGAMAELTASIRSAVPSIRLRGLVADYTTALRWLATEDDSHRNLVLFLGSNIGNFNAEQARAFLRRLWAALRPDDYMLIGFDLKKDIDLLLHAYNDSQGVTAAFNKNLLARINRELGGHFDLAKFRHYATYDVFSGAMESYLVSLAEQVVAIDMLHSDFAFEAWEPVHTEYSYKYLDQDIDSLATDTGFVIEASFYDAKRWFVASLWRVDKEFSGSTD